ncbi:putative acyl-activating enzyme 19 [Forsythia ovata]|uniref:Acyl-activating enzyme 19 n=1 Tax=Forsythia ovata TaxID=205694 RepID=A0ABD1TMY9_9LAMI
MASGEATEHKLSACCISHQFQKAASEYPEKIGVIHASGFAQIAREFHRNHNTDQPIDDDNNKFMSGETTSTSHPPCYEGDQCFTFSDIISAVENLSCRLRRILDGADDPYLVKPHSVKISSKKSELVQVSESFESSSLSLQYSTEFQNTYTPKVIGIFMEPSVEYIVAVLSILRCGEAFMPLDPTWPKSRILSVVSLSKADLIIGCESSIWGNCCHRLDTFQWLIDDGSCPVLSISMKNNIKEQFHSSLLAWPCESENVRSFCYLMYTSGSTGKPKGVCGTEIGLLNRFLWMQEIYPLHGGDLLLFKTPISFIDHLQEFLGALLASCTLVIPPFNQLKENIFYIVDFLQGYFINRLVAVPSLMRAILPALQSLYYARVQGSLKLIVLSGEVVHLSLWEMLVKLLPHTSVLNLYGSTEVTGDCTYFDCKRLPLILENETLGSVPIGLPISNCNVVLFGENGTDQGEIYVGGHCIAAGYFCYPYLMPLELVELPPHNYGGGPSSMCRVQCYFKTGDFAKKLLSGDLVFIGRKDRTIKVNGQRIALEEIENTFREHPDVVDAAVICREVEGEILLLEAYLVTEKGDIEGKTLKSSIRSWIQSKLPQTMIPRHIFFIRSLPLSSSGKVDYWSLAGSIYSSGCAVDNVEENSSDSRIQVIKKVFSDALMVEKISEEDDFFEMGGNSISAAYASFKLGIHMKSLYSFPTAQKLQMALLSSNYNLSTNSHLGLDLREPEGDILLSSESRILGIHGSKPRARLYVSDSERDARNPPKHLKTKSNLYTDSTEPSPRDGDSANHSPVHLACSFSRCNKVIHGGQCEGNTFCHAVWSNEISREGRGYMQEMWKVDMESCVDASPLIVFKESDIYLFIGSHSHKFTCIDAKSGIVRWETKLQGRVECSAAILDDFSQIVVGCYQGIIYFLDFSSGSVCWSFRTYGEVKSQPVVDKCRNLVWCGSYDHNLYAIDYKSYGCTYKLPCGGSIYGSPAIDEVQEKLYVASTSGHVTALSIKASPFNKLWMQDLGAPVFGSLSINCSNGNVISCLVDGTVVALTSCGSVIWKGITGGPIFAGPCISQSLPSQVVVCSRDGSIYSFEMEKGNLLWEHAIGHPITSSPCVDENLQLASDVSQLSDRLICVCDSSGSIRVLLIDLNALGDLNQNKKYRVQEFARLDVGGDIFSSPVMIGGKIFVGCRDNHVYCIELRSKYEHNPEVGFCC